jgi:hypothetical protein
LISVGNRGGTNFSPRVKIILDIATHDEKAPLASPGQSKYFPLAGRGQEEFFRGASAATFALELSMRSSNEFAGAAAAQLEKDRPAALSSI